MAEYTLITPLEAHAYGEDTPPSWYDELIASRMLYEQDDKFRLITLDGPENGTLGDYIVYVAAAGSVPRHAYMMRAADFELVYEPVPE